MFSAKSCLSIQHRPVLHIRSVPLTIERSIPSTWDILLYIFTAPFVWYDFIIAPKKQSVQSEKAIADYRKKLYPQDLKKHTNNAILIKQVGIELTRFYLQDVRYMRRIRPQCCIRHSLCLQVSRLPLH